MESHENFDHNVKRLVGNTGGDVEPSKHRQWVFLIVKCIPESPALSSQSILAARGTMLATRSNSSLNPCGRKGTIHPLKIGRSNHPVWRYFNKYEGASLMKMKKAVLNKGKTGQIKCLAPLSYSCRPQVTYFLGRKMAQNVTLVVWGMMMMMMKSYSGTNSVLDGNYGRPATAHDG